jgi:1-acyl-sn-glycerol-3-phosphate acyltransferase
LVFRVKVVGSENEPIEGGFLVCSNHISKLDPVLLSIALKKHQLSIMAKKELFKIPLLSQLIRIFGAYPVDRSGNDVGAVKKPFGFCRKGNVSDFFLKGQDNRIKIQERPK